MPFAHKGLAGSVDMRSYTSTLHGRVSIQRCGTEGAGRLAGGRPVAYLFIYPNLMISTCSGEGTHHLRQRSLSSPDVYGHWMDINLVRPTAVDACEVDFWYEAAWR